jgi:CheY-like chemotaxis protein
MNTAAPKRILCVEDDEDTCQLLSLIFDSNEYQFVFTTTAEEALEKARVEKFDLYFFDVELPGEKSGLDLARAIREFDQNTPLVFHSADAMPWQVEEGLAVGASEYITKPSDFDELTETIRRLTS